MVGQGSDRDGRRCSLAWNPAGIPWLDSHETRKAQRTRDTEFAIRPIPRNGETSDNEAPPTAGVGQSKRGSPVVRVYPLGTDRAAPPAANGRGPDKDGPG